MRALAAAALLLLMFPAGGRAAADYGGGTAPDSVAPGRRQLTIVAIRMADRRHGGRARRQGRGRLRRRRRSTRIVRSPPTARFAVIDDRADRATGGGVQRRIAASGSSAGCVGPVAGGTVRRAADVPARRPRGRALRLRACAAWHARARRRRRRRGGGRPRYYGAHEPDRRGRTRSRCSVGGVGACRAAVFDYRMQLPARGGVEPNNITPGGPIARRRHVQPARARSRCRFRERPRALPREVDGQLHADRRRRNAVGESVPALARRP